MFHVEHFACDPMEILKEGASALDISLSPRAIHRFEVYLREVKEWNRAFNLTSLKEDRDIVIKHFLDSLAASPFLEGTHSLLDIGSGAGFPGVPLKISLEHLYVALVDSSLKKVRFLQHLIRSLELQDISAFHRRLDWRQGIQNESFLFDAVISRGTLTLLDLLRTATHFLNPGGRVLWMYGSKEKSKAIVKALPEEILRFFDIHSFNAFPLPYLHHQRIIAGFQRI